MPETVVLVLRHGKVDNPLQVVYGRLPGYRLSEEGRLQVERVAERLSGTPLAAIYTSPLLRARQTAELVARRFSGVPVKTSRLLLEVRTSWDGEPFHAVPHQPHRYNYYDPPRHPADESPADLYARMRRFVDRTVRRHPGATVLAVSHGDPIAALRLGMEGHSPTLALLRSDRYPLQASILRLAFRDGGVEVEYLPPPTSVP